MAVTDIVLDATVDPSNRWVVLTLTATGMTKATIYRSSADGTQAVRGAFNVDAPGSLVVADYEAPQGVSLSYFARTSDGTGSYDSSVAVTTGAIDRGGDVVFGLANPLAWLPLNVIGIKALAYESNIKLVNVLGRPDPIAVSDVRKFPSGTLEVYTLEDSERLSLLSLLTGSSVMAFSPSDPAYGFSDVWYFAVGKVTESRVSPLGTEPARKFSLEVTRIAPPPAEFVGPAFRIWETPYNAPKTWGQWYTEGLTWLNAQVSS